jgi:hypothetical protein
MYVQIHMNNYPKCMPKSKNIGIFHPILIPGKNKHDFYDVLAQSFHGVFGWEVQVGWTLFLECLVHRPLDWYIARRE